MKQAFTVCIAFLASLFLAVSAQAYQPFPDTGQTMCYDAGNNAVSCDTIKPGDPYYGQDAHYQPRIPRSYTKLGHGGVELPDSALHIDDGGNWIMTRDNVTGLIWEVKTYANRNDTYSWQDAQNLFIAGLNNAEFGGFSNWRLPSRKDLVSLVNRGNYSPAINTDFFPNTMSSDYSYSSSTTSTAFYTNLPWYVNFLNGYAGSYSTSDSYYVRAVRAGHSPSSNFVDNGDGTVSDIATGLMWQKCSYGQGWDGNQCTGSAVNRNWQQAMEAAESLKLAGFNDWRLPNINELQTLVDDTTYDPAIDTDFFPETSSWVYWSSSTTVFPYTFRAWLVVSYSGQVASLSKPDDFMKVRAVRTVPMQPRRMSLPGVLMLLLDDE